MNESIFLYIYLPLKTKTNAFSLQNAKSRVTVQFIIVCYVQVTVTKIGKLEEASVLESVKADHVTLMIKVCMYE